MSKSFNDEIDTRTNIDEIIKKLSQGLSKTEIQKLERAIKTPKVLEQFEDPLTARRIIESFKATVFRSQFFEDPLTAISKISRRSTDPQPDIP